MKKAKISILSALLLVIFQQVLYGQDQPGYNDELAKRAFYVDFAAFDDSLSENIDIQIYYKIFSSNLTYQKFGEKFKAQYSVDVTVKSKGKQITGLSNESQLFADDYRGTMASDDFAINAFQLNLPPENYEILVRLTDIYSGDSYTERREMKLKDFGKSLPFMSTLEFVREIAPAGEGSRFDRGDNRILPSVSRVYGFNESQLIMYYQIYNKPGFNGDYLAFYEITSGNKIILTDTTLFPATGQVTARTEIIDVSDFLPDKYELNLKISSPGNKVELKSKADFFVEWSVNAIVKNDYRTAIEQLKYVATQKQLDSLLHSPENDHVRVWESFWRSKDPTPGTPENELKEEYYRRIRYAEINYGHMGRDGWKTDRGMVYVTYGPADDIESHPFEFDTKPYQVWFYYNLKLRFVFVDINGYGDYELQYPYDGDIRKLR